MSFKSLYIYSKMVLKLFFSIVLDLESSKDKCMHPIRSRAWEWSDSRFLIVISLLPFSTQSYPSDTLSTILHRHAHHPLSWANERILIIRPMFSLLLVNRPTLYYEFPLETLISIFLKECITSCPHSIIIFFLTSITLWCLPLPTQLAYYI